MFVSILYLPYPLLFSTGHSQRSAGKFFVIDLQRRSEAFVRGGDKPSQSGLPVIRGRYSRCATQ